MANVKVTYHFVGLSNTKLPPPLPTSNLVKVFIPSLFQWTAVFWNMARRFTYIHDGTSFKIKRCELFWRKVTSLIISLRGRNSVSFDMLLIIVPASSKGNLIVLVWEVRVHQNLSEKGEVVGLKQNLLQPPPPSQNKIWDFKIPAVLD